MSCWINACKPVYSATVLTPILKINVEGHHFGPGKAQLLELIAETGSISQAAKKMQMSYRRAWLLIDELNQMFAEPCVEKTTGGAHGGGAKVTAFGQRVVVAFRNLEQHTALEVAKEFKTLK